MPYAGPFSLITGGLLGQDNPRDDIAAWANETQRRNRAAVGLDANGNPLPTNLDANGNPVAPAPPDPNQQTAAVTGQALANGQMQPGQEPQATKTPDSLGALLMNLTQYQMREQGFNQAMGMGFAAVSQPRDREMVSKMFNVNEPDVAATGRMAMDAATQQQGQDRMNSLGLMISDPVQGSQIAKALHMPGATPAEQMAALQAAYRADPQGVGRMITQTQQPTPQMANLEQIANLQQQYAAQSKNPTADKSQLSSLRNQILASVAGTDAAPMIADQLNYLDKHGTLPPWHDNLQAYHQNIANQKELSDSAATAGAIHGKQIANVTDMNNRVQAINNSPGLDSILNSVGPKKQAAQWLIKQPLTDPASMLIKSLPAGVSFDTQELAVLDNIRQLNGQQYATALHQLGLTRPSEREIEGINAGIGQTNNLDLDPTTYRSQALEPMDEFLKTMRANSYGASQAFSNMPKNLRTYVDPEYIKNGMRNIEDSGSEDWADSTKMTDDEVTAASNLLTSGKINPATKAPWTRADVDKLVRAEGKRPLGY